VPVVARVTRFHFVTTPHTAAGVTLSSPAPEESAPETFRRAVFTVEIPPPGRYLLVKLRPTETFTSKFQQC